MQLQKISVLVLVEDSSSFSLFHKYLLLIHNVLGTVLGAEAETRTRHTACFQIAHDLVSMTFCSRVLSTSPSTAHFLTLLCPYGTHFSVHVP